MAPPIKTPPPIRARHCGVLPGSINHRSIAGPKEAALIREYQAGDERAGGQLLLAHDAFIAMKAWPWILHCRRKRIRIDDEDLRQEGRRGFLRAVRRFDFSIGVKLSTYAGWWIMHYVKRYVQNHGGDIRVPVHLQDKGNPLVFAERMSGTSADGEPFQIDVADEAISPEEHVIEQHTTVDGAQRVEKLLGTLTEREATIMRRRLGLPPYTEAETLQEIADKFGVTRERIRQIEAKAKKKMRAFVYLLDLENADIRRIRNRAKS